jgi:hypothetical protein
MSFTYENKVVDNIFTTNEINQIYKHVGETPEDKRMYVKDFSHLAYLSWLPDNIVKKVTEIARAETGLDLELRELSFARYSKFGSEDVEPKLFPHLDETFKEPRITFDIQVESTIDWPIVVEGNSFTLKDNQAIIFSGTHQVHWREKVKFDMSDHTDMIFCHFSVIGSEPNSLGDEHYMPLIERRDQLMKIYNESN